MGNKLKDPILFLDDDIFPPGGVEYHFHLAKLGKTPLDDPAEYQLLGSAADRLFGRRLNRTTTTEEDSYGNGRGSADTRRIIPRMDNQVFLYEPSQLFDQNDTRALQFRTDLSHFLGLDVVLDPIQNTRVGKGSDYHYKIDICEQQYIDVRRELLAMGGNASTWIRNYFLNAPDVYYSSFDSHFENMIASWSEDPCANDNNDNTDQ